MDTIVVADLTIKTHADAVISLLNAYAKDIMGGGDELSAFVKSNLITELKQRQGVHIVLAFVEDEPAGLAICFEGFSTFACKPLLNIHDLSVAPTFRSRGLAKKIMVKIEYIAKSIDCCKITLEVLEGNKVAQSLYNACGYAGYSLDSNMGKAMFWQKKLSFS